MLRHTDWNAVGLNELLDTGYDLLDDEPPDHAPYDGPTFAAAFFGWLVASALQYSPWESSPRPARRSAGTGSASGLSREPTQPC